MYRSYQSPSLTHCVGTFLPLRLGRWYLEAKHTKECRFMVTYTVILVKVGVRLGLEFGIDLGLHFRL